MDMNPLSNLDNVQPDTLGDEPIVVLNLLKFESPASISSYMDYGAEFFRTFAQRGAEVLYCGKLMEKVQGDAGDWDVVLLVRYPNRKFFYDMLRSDEYQSFSHFREDALENGVLQPSEALMPYRTQAIKFDGGEWTTEILSRLENS